MARELHKARVGRVLARPDQTARGRRLVEEALPGAEEQVPSQESDARLAALREANSKVVNLVLPAQVACELNAPLSSLENLQLTVKKGNIGRGGGDRTQRYALLSY